MARGLGGKVIIQAAATSFIHMQVVAKGLVPDFVPPILSHPVGHPGAALPAPSCVRTGRGPGCKTR